MNDDKNKEQDENENEDKEAEDTPRPPYTPDRKLPGQYPWLSPA